jgi:hypothetical protein
MRPIAPILPAQRQLDPNDPIADARARWPRSGEPVKRSRVAGAVSLVVDLFGPRVMKRRRAMAHANNALAKALWVLPPEHAGTPQGGDAARAIIELTDSFARLQRYCPALALRGLVADALAAEPQLGARFLVFHRQIFEKIAMVQGQFCDIGLIGLDASPAGASRRHPAQAFTASLAEIRAGFLQFADDEFAAGF